MKKLLIVVLLAVSLVGCGKTVTPDVSGLDVVEKTSEAETIAKKVEVKFVAVLATTYDECGVSRHVDKLTIKCTESRYHDHEYREMLKLMVDYAEEYGYDNERHPIALITPDFYINGETILRVD